MEYVVAFFVLLFFGLGFLLVCFIAIVGHAYQANSYEEKYLARQRRRYKPIVSIMNDRDTEDSETYDGSEYVDGHSSMFGDWMP